MDATNPALSHVPSWGNPMKRRGFTLLEMLVATAALLIIMLVLFQAINSSSSLWSRSIGKIQVFQSARAAFESLTRNLSQATLQGYYGYADATGLPVPLVNPSFTGDVGTARLKIPVKYLRQSELHFYSGPSARILSGELDPKETPGFAIFFQAPLGHSQSAIYNVRPGLLNNCGYYVQYCRNDDGGGKGTAAIPSFTQSQQSRPAPSYRYRLMEVAQPAEINEIYDSTNRIDPATGIPVFGYDIEWIRRLQLQTRKNRHVLADNILLLAARPKLAGKDEIQLSSELGLSMQTPGDGSLVSPRMEYDSRSWEPNYTGDGIKGESPAERQLLEKAIMNRLPPIVEVVLVAVDEKSALQMESRYGETDGSSPPLSNPSLMSSLGLATAFADATRFTEDLDILEDGLKQARIDYRIFHTEVRIPGAAYGE